MVPENERCTLGVLNASSYYPLPWVIILSKGLTYAGNAAM